MLSNIVYNKSCLRYLEKNPNMFGLGWHLFLILFVVRSFLIHCGNTLRTADNNQLEIWKGIINLFNDNGLIVFY